MVTANYILFTLKSLKGMLGTNQCNQCILDEGIQEDIRVWKNVYKIPSSSLL